jgi:hypothetical protein
VSTPTHAPEHALCCPPAPTSYTPCTTPPLRYAHEGIYRCARAIRADLRRHQLLDALLLGEGPAAGGSLPDCSGYELLITGHSLGERQGGSVGRCWGSGAQLGLGSGSQAVHSCSTPGCRRAGIAPAS